MSNLPAQTAPVYCTDEDIAVRAGGDWFLLAPAWQQMAAGTDGYFNSGSPWVLNSTATNFQQRTTFSRTRSSSSRRPSNTSPAAASSSRSIRSPGTSITLRRLHKDLNVGQPPAPAAGLTGVTFTINTLDPQIEEASFDIKRRFGIDENIAYRTSSWIYDLRDLRMATVLYRPIGPVHARGPDRHRRLGAQDRPDQDRARNCP